LTWIKETRSAEGKGMAWTAKRLLLAFVLLMGMLLALVGCGGAGGGAENAEGGKPEESGGRAIETAMGKVEVPERAERVVVLDTGELDSAMTLGVKPVGAVEAIESSGYPKYLERTEGIENVGTIEQPNLEAIAALEPDLILSSKLRHEQIYDQLSQIAPTVFTESTGVTWKENFDVHAEALGRTEEAERVKEEYRARVDEFKQKVGENPPEVSVVRFLAGDTRIYQKASFVGTVLEDAGLPRPPSQDVDDFAITNASAELIPDMGGDVIFVTAYGPEEETTKSEILNDPLWQQLEAVQQGRVHEVSDDLWMLGIGYTAANGVVDDLTKYLADGGTTMGGATSGTTMGATTMGTTN
jgi:iron complex transport system substrate-binding protein